TSWNHKLLIVVVDHFNTELLHDMQRNINVRL
ncbi:hypothetical protein D047_0089B, partial [Vibrio parahaemolyticus VPTS-2010_2]